MVQSAEISAQDKTSVERDDDGASRCSKHRDDEKHRSHESKSSKHKHKHHKHKHRRKHKKGNADAGGGAEEVGGGAEEIAGDVGDCGAVDGGPQIENMPEADPGGGEEVTGDVGDCGVVDGGPQIGNMPEAGLELADLQVNSSAENSARADDAAQPENEQAEENAEMSGLDETQKNVGCAFSGSDNVQKLDEEMEEGEILDDDMAVGDRQVDMFLPDSLPVDSSGQSHDGMKITDDGPLEIVSIKVSESSTEQKSDDSFSESRSVYTSGRKEETIKQSSSRKEDIDLEQASEASISPGKPKNSIGSCLSSEKASERGRRSRSLSKDFRNLRNTLRSYDDERCSMSRDLDHNNRYARSNHDRTDGTQQLRSQGHSSRHIDDFRRSQENVFEKQNVHTWHEERCTRSRDHGRLEYADRRRSSSRSGRDYPDRRQSRSRGVYGDSMDKRRRSRSIESSRNRDRRRSLSRSGRDRMKRRRSRSKEIYREHMDKRRRSRSKERSRDQRISDTMFHRNSKSTQSGGTNDVSKGENRHQEEVKRFKEVDVVMREEEREDLKESFSLQLEEEDVDKEVEKIRLRRQAILEKHKKQEQLESMKNMDLNVGLDLSESTGTGNAKILLDEHESDVSNFSKDAFNFDKGSMQNGLPDRRSRLKSLGQGTPKSEEKSNDAVNDYIFGESPAGGQKQVKGDGVALETSGLTDNWDDAEGYYCHRIGEVLDGRYEIAASHGRGVFSSVVRARDFKASRRDLDEIAIKIIRNNDVMLKSGQQELSILRKLDGADPENRRHCVRFLTSFDYRKHLCLVFESMHMNLREVLKKFGRNIGLNLSAVRAYAKQLFIALKHLRNCGVLHCDIKPDNMLVNESKNVLKLCDFGSAMFAGENEITPYLVSRFYRAPEIILGLSYDHPLDMWSVGCCLYEFFTGKVLFPGPTNNDMLRLHMELKGPFPKKMLKKAFFLSKHFDQDYNFCAAEEDPVTKASIKRVLMNVKPKDIATLVTGQGTTDENGKMLNNFRDMLDKIFMLDPEKRLTVSQALSHPFITGK